MGSKQGVQLLTYSIKLFKLFCKTNEFSQFQRKYLDDGSILSFVNLQINYLKGK